jgi:hypothetical protein
VVHLGQNVEVIRDGSCTGGEGTVKIYDGLWVLDSADEVCE